MIAAAARLLARVRVGSAAGWKQACRAGAPVPEPHRCAAIYCDSVPLLVLREGEGGTVSCLQEPESHAAAKLAAFGVLPGTPVVLVQRYPAFVLRLGYTELAVDEEIAGHIRVLRAAP